MKQKPPRKPQTAVNQKPIKYGDNFHVSGDLVAEPIAPRDAAMMQSAETILFGQTLKGGPAAFMQSSAARNKNAGVVGRHDATDASVGKGMMVAEIDVSGARIVIESIGRQFRDYVDVTVGRNVRKVAVIIGEAFEPAPGYQETGQSTTAMPPHYRQRNVGQPGRLQESPAALPPATTV